MAATPLISENESAFLDLLLSQEKRDAGAAYQAVYKCSDKSAPVQASKMLAKPKIRDELKRRRAALAQKLNLTAADILGELRDVIVADPRELMEYRIGACRFCYGHGHQYQRTPNEYRQAIEAYRESNAAAVAAGKGEPDPCGLHFDAKGGVGYNRTTKPHKACPECHGLGVGYSYLKDSRTVSKAAARLFVAVEDTANGTKIKTRSADKSVELLMRHLGMLDPDRDDGKVSPEEKANEIKALLKEAGATVGRPQ